MKTLNEQLFTAVFCGNSDEVKPLIEAGADVNIKDKYGKTPIDYANFQKMKDLLLSYKK